jgi:diaminopimelate epimerase
MGTPKINRDNTWVEAELADPVGALQKVSLFCVDMGNPHAVLFVDELTDELVEGLGPQLESHPLFPNRVNVGFCQVVSEQEVNLRVYERGAGETQACGTGACAAAVASMVARGCATDLAVHLTRGDLQIKWNPLDPEASLWMTGPAEEVFQGTVPH